MRCRHSRTSRENWRLAGEVRQQRSADPFRHQIRAASKQIQFTDGCQPDVRKRRKL